MSTQLFGPQIGIVAGTDLNRHVLKKLLLDSGYGARCVDPQALSQCLQEDTNQPDAWLLDSSDPDVDQLVAQIVQYSETPFLVNDECPPVQPDALKDWRRRVLDKLEELVASVSATDYADIEKPQAIWVLAASTGGPEAVSAFLAALRPGLPIAMVYAQHIEQGFDQILKNALGKHRHYPSKLCRGEQYLCKGGLLVVPADRQLRFLPFHRVLETRNAWEGRYQPAIDQVVGELARLYQERCGIIVFSGLCDDGALGSRVIQANGGEVWVQTPSSCVSPDMPNAALATGLVSMQGTPTQLAQAMNTRYSSVG